MRETLRDLLGHFDSKDELRYIYVSCDEVADRFSNDELHEEPWDKLLDRYVEEWKFDCENNTLDIDLE